MLILLFIEFWYSKDMLWYPLAIMFNIDRATVTCILTIIFTNVIQPRWFSSLERVPLSSTCSGSILRLWWLHTYALAAMSEEEDYICQKSHAHIAFEACLFSLYGTGMCYSFVPMLLALPVSHFLIYLLINGRVCFLCVLSRLLSTACLTWLPTMTKASRFHLRDLSYTGPFLVDHSTSH